MQKNNNFLNKTFRNLCIFSN